MPSLFSSCFFSIRYLLLDCNTSSIKIHFSKGFTIITGETGSGKSILLDALALVLGRRADLSALRNPEEKCVVEAEFAIASYGLADFFQQEELDYEPLTIIRREILPSGKSRAFVNDSPVTLDVLSSLGKALIDIHSQHDTQQLRIIVRKRLIFIIWCPGSDSNRHTLRREILSLLCLPISPPGQVGKPPL